MFSVFAEMSQTFLTSILVGSLDCLEKQVQRYIQPLPPPALQAQLLPPPLLLPLHQVPFLALHQLLASQAAVTQVRLLLLTALKKLEVAARVKVTGLKLRGIFFRKAW